MHAPIHPTATDMALIRDLLKFTDPDAVPLQFVLGDRIIKGIPAEFSPTVTYRLLDCNMVQYVIEGQKANWLIVGSPMA